MSTLIQISGGGGATFDGQLTQGGVDVSTSNPLPVTDPITLPLPTGASTENKQTESITQIQKVVKNTIEFYTEDLEEDTATATTYIGKQSVEGQWVVHKIVDAVVGTITTTSLQYATVVNNTSVLTYAGAWTNRSTLTYSEIKNLL